MSPIKTLFTALLLCATVSADKIAIFPTQQTNADQSFADAFCQLLASKYENISGQTVIPPQKSGKVFDSLGDYSKAATALGADEYIEIKAIGLYISRKEIIGYDSSRRNVQIVISSDGSKDKDEKDQDILDNSKTIVTTTRYSKDGTKVYRSELTLLTYGDIEESTERFVLSLYKKLPIDQVRGMTNVTRRERMGNNQLFSQKIKGFKFGVIMPTVLGKKTPVSSMLTIGFHYKLDSEKWMIDLGAGGRIPGSMHNDSLLSYGGFNAELGMNYYLVSDIYGIYFGGGINPFINFFEFNNHLLGVAPYILLGFIMPRNSAMKFYAEIKIAQQVIPFSTTVFDTSTGTYPTYNYAKPGPRVYPTELGISFGIGW